MKTFTDPINKIPPFSESDINSKIIISKIFNNNIVIMNYMIKDQCGKILTKDYDVKSRYSVYWSPEYGCGKTMLDVIIKQYKISLSQGYKMLYYVIESDEELKTFIKRNQIKNTKLVTELLERWKQLEENKNIK